MGGGDYDYDHDYEHEHEHEHLTMSIRRLGIAFVVSGPSGTGKTSLCDRLLAADSNLYFSVSCTTRAPRTGEVDGEDYYFLAQDDFDARVAAGEFLEHATVHGNSYGTLKSEVEKHLKVGADVLLDIDVQGAAQVRAATSDDFLQKCVQFVFVGPPSLDELERRLRNRGTDDEATIQRRLAGSKAELEQWQDYEYLVINDDFEAALEKMSTILEAERLVTPRLQDRAPWE
jgi:guanylate kinase